MNTYDEVLTKITTDIINNTSLKNISPGSIIRTMVSEFGAVANDMNFNISTTFLNSVVSTAVGPNLDLIGKLLNVSRTNSSYAIGTVRIYIDPYSGKTLANLKSILNITGDITLPRGTEVSDSSGLYKYNLIDNVILSDDPIYVDVISQASGSVANSGSGAISMFSNYDPSLLNIINYILVSNDLPIDSAADNESDDDYRYRIVNSYTANAMANETAVRLAALKVPGVANVLMVPYEYGIGTGSVYVISESPIVSAGILNAVQVACTSVSSFSERVVVSAPSYQALYFNIQLEFKPSTAAADKDSAVQTVSTNVMSYVNNIPLGGKFVYNEMSAVIMNSSTNILTFSMIQMAVGDYNLTTGLINYAQNLLNTDYSGGSTVKLVTNSKLSSVCYL